MTDPLVLVCGADDGFAKPLAVTLYSALSNYCGTDDVRVHVIDGGISAANRARVDRIVKTFGTAVEWMSPDLTLVRQLTVSERFPASIYLRLLVPSLLPTAFDKAIYLDSDVVVDDDIGALWKESIGDKSLLAVQDSGAPTFGSPWGLAHYREFGLRASTRYFNSGVLVFNLRRWREQRLAERVLRFVAAHGDQIRFFEQDAMNAVLWSDWRALDSRWNQLVSPWEIHERRELQRGILHFVSTSKPWNPQGAHWTNFIYDQYLKRSGWYSSLQWLSYYLPLVLRRQQVLHLRRTVQATRARETAAAAAHAH
ncbi:MAG TPA: glycosyltransferase family 8 protein [Gemmatimonadaceae bacterium]|nr:glycosyltransferase family 8 protein [Gemmatimonadaceae bacterium]